MTSFVAINNPWVVLDRIAEIVLYNVRGCIVEIGIGRSTLVLENLARKYNRVFYTVDRRGSKYEWAKKHITYEQAHINHMLAATFMETFKYSPAIVLLDGSHKIECVTDETYFFLNKLHIGGILFIHDTAPKVKSYESKISQGKPMDTYKIRKDLEKAPNYDVFTWRYTAGRCGLTMVLKKDMRDPDYRI